MSQLLTNIKKNLFALMILTMILAITLGYLYDFSHLKNYINIVLFMMIYPMMINLDIIDVLKGIGNYKPILLSIGINFIISPLIILGIHTVFPQLNQEVFIGLLLIALLPTSGMTASWTGIAKGDLKLSLILISTNLLLSIALIPIYLNVFIGNAIDLNTLVIVKSLLKVVATPLILGDLTRRLLIKNYGEGYFKNLKPNFSGISSIALLLIVFVAFSLRSKTILSNLSFVTQSIIPIIMYYLAIMTISEIIGRKFLCYEENIALVYGTSLRNLTIALGFAVTSISNSYTVLIITIAYIVQIPMGSLYMQYLSKKIENNNLENIKCS